MSVTIDQALIDGVQTYRNGCNFRLIGKRDGSYWLGYGCYCLVNLATGPERLLIDWLGGPDAETRRLDDVKPETIHHLLKQPPCIRCGGARFEVSSPTGQEANNG